MVSVARSAPSANSTDAGTVIPPSLSTTSMAALAVPSVVGRATVMLNVGSAANSSGVAMSSVVLPSAK